MEKAIEIAAESGLWALISVILLFYVLQDSSRRELKYIEREDKYIEREENYIETIRQNQIIIRENQEINKELAKRLSTIDLMHKDLSYIKKQLDTIR